MNKVIAKRRMQTLLASKGLSATYTTGRIADRIAIKNKKGECIASGTIKLDSSKKEYTDADLSATLKAMRSLNCTADFEGADAEFIEDAESIVEDEDGNVIDVEAMLVVQDTDSNEISLWVPEEGETENDLPPTVTVIGVVSEPLDSIDSDKLNSDYSGDYLTSTEFDAKAMRKLLPGNKINAVYAVAVECGDGTGGYIFEDTRSGAILLLKTTEQAIVCESMEEAAEIVLDTWR